MILYFESYTLTECTKIVSLLPDRIASFQVPMQVASLITSSLVLINEAFAFILITAFFTKPHSFQIISVFGYRDPSSIRLISVYIVVSAVTFIAVLNDDPVHAHQLCMSIFWQTGGYWIEIQ